MINKFRISIFCPDQIGLISAITDRLFDLGINLGDTSFAVLGSGAEFTLVCSAPEDITSDEIHHQLKELPVLTNAEVSVKPFSLKETHDSTAQVTHQILLEGGDNPGLVARLSEVFVEFEANIVRLNTEKIPLESGDQYLINFSVWIPEAVRETCLATVENTANSLRMNCKVTSITP